MTPAASVFTDGRAIRKVNERRLAKKNNQQAIVRGSLLRFVSI